MSSYLQQQSKRLDARSRSIEARESNAGYTRFLEDQIAKLAKRDSEVNSMQTKIIDLQTAIDRLLNRESRLESENNGRLKQLAKLEEKISTLETLQSRVEGLEKQSNIRLVGKHP